MIRSIRKLHRNVWWLLSFFRTFLWKHVKILANFCTFWDFWIHVKVSASPEINWNHNPKENNHSPNLNTGKSTPPFCLAIIGWQRLETKCPTLQYVYYWSSSHRVPLRKYVVSHRFFSTKPFIAFNSWHSCSNVQLSWERVSTLFANIPMRIL